jgi:hypothetical protein
MIAMVCHTGVAQKGFLAMAAKTISRRRELSGQRVVKDGTMRLLGAR